MRKASIQPQPAFANGLRVLATQLAVVSVADNLFDRVTFKYTLYDANDEFAGESTFTLDGIEEYATWDNSPEDAYKIVAAGIDVTLIDETTKMFEVE
jgi:hypothetical protein